MPDTSTARPPGRDRQARLAGLAYMMVVLTGTYSLGLAPGIALEGADATARALSAAAHADLIKLIVVGEVACYTAFAVLAVTLHRLLAPVEEQTAALMAVLALISVPFGFANVGPLLEIVRVAEAITPGAAPDPASLSAIAEATARHRAGILVQSVPWGLWLLPLGWLSIRSGFLSRVIGVGLILAGLGYVVHFVSRLLIDGYRESVWPEVLAAPRVSEIAMAIWLLILGDRGLDFSFARKGSAR